MSFTGGLAPPVCPVPAACCELKGLLLFDRFNAANWTIAACSSKRLKVLQAMQAVKGLCWWQGAACMSTRALRVAQDC